MMTPEARMVEVGLILDLMHAVQRVHYADMPFIDAVECMALGAVIVHAQENNRPLSAVKLAEQLGMSRPTLLRRLAVLEARGTIRRDGNEIRFVAFSKPLVRDARKLILAAAAALSKLDIG